MHAPGFKVYQKVVLVWAAFVALHFAYALVPAPPVKAFSGINESVFQHLKVGFFIYLLASLVELALFKRRVSDKQSYLFSRLTVTVFFPWIIFILWYVAPAFYGRMPSSVLEAVYGNLVLIVAAYFAAEIEQGLAQMVFSRPLKAVVLTLVVVSFCLYIIFTFNLPWTDLFQDPKLIPRK
jgi:hypothetical protein